MRAVTIFYNVEESWVYHRTLTKQIYNWLAANRA